MSYRAETGSLNVLSAGVSLALPGVDFSSEEQTVLLEDGQQATVIAIAIANVSRMCCYAMYVATCLLNRTMLQN